MTILRQAVRLFLHAGLQMTLLVLAAALGRKGY